MVPKQGPFWPLGNIWQCLEMICKHFLPSHRLPFHSVDGFFSYAEAFNSDVVSLVYFCFFCLRFGVKSKKSLPRLMSKSFLPIFSSRSLWFKSYIQVFNPFWVDFCILCKIVVQFHSFACSCPVFPIPLIKGTVLSPLYILASLS